MAKPLLKKTGLNQVFENPYMRLWVEDGILHCVFSDKLEMTIGVARLCVLDRIAFSEGQSYPCLINMKGLISISKEAREYLADEGSRLVTAGALMTDSAVTRMLGNLFLTLNKPKVPTKLFSNESEALTWLQKYL